MARGGWAIDDDSQLHRIQAAHTGERWSAAVTFDGVYHGPMLTLTASLLAPLLLAASPAPSALASWTFDDCDPGAATFASSPGASFAGTKMGFVGCNIGRRGLAGAFHGVSS